MKVIIDTNVWISGTFWKGDSSKTIQAWKDSKFILVITKELILELYQILKDFKIQLSEETILKITSSIMSNAEIVEPKQKLNIIQEDSNDNMFLEAAEESNADFIITQDNHLLKLKSYKQTKIITPKEFVHILNNKNLYKNNH